MIISLASAETLDRVVAIVNDDVVTQSELHTETQNITLQMRAMGQPVPEKAALSKQVLNHIIDKKLQLQIAKQLNITVGDKELNSVINRIASQNNMTQAQLVERIQLEGMSVSAYKNNLREQLLLQKVQQHEVASKITITPDEVARIMETKSVSDKKNPATKKAIENQLLQEKFAEAGTVWLSKLRGLAYIEIKSDH